MCNDRSSFSTFKNLSLSIVIELRDGNSITTMHYGFVNIIQGYQVKSLNTTTFRHSLLSINQLDLGRYMAILWDGLCAITLPSSCTIAGELVNGIYIIITATALLSSTTKSGRMRKRASSLARVVINEPTIESSESLMITSTSAPASSVPSAPSTAVTRTTHKSLTVPESTLWH